MIRNHKLESKLAEEIVGYVLVNTDDYFAAEKELAQLSHNSAMRKLPTFDEFLNWSGDPVMSHDLRDFYFFFTGNYPQ